MIYTFAITFIGLMVLRSPFALLLSVIIAIIDALPFFGSGFILWPGAVIPIRNVIFNIELSFDDINEYPNIKLFS